MTTTKELLQTLNALRTANGKTELASWKSSREKLEAAISELQPTDTTDPTMPMGENGNELVDELPKPKRMTPDELLRSKGAITQVPGHEDYQPVSKPAQQPAASDLTDVESQAEPTDLTSVQKSPRGAIGALVIELLVTEMPYEDIVKQVRETYPDARTTARSIASVAMDLRRDGVNVPSRRKPAKAPLHVRIAETNQHEEG